MVDALFPPGFYEPLLQAVTPVLPLIALAVLILLIGACSGVLKRQADREWLAAWTDATERARAAGVPVTAEDSVADINNRISWAREERVRGKIRR